MPTTIEPPTRTRIPTRREREYERPTDVPPHDLPPLDLPPLRGIPGLNDGTDSRLSRGNNIKGPWVVILYNDDWHTFDDVIGILQKATGCTEEQGEAVAWEVHTQGRAICFDGSLEECERVAAVIATIRLQVETDRA